MTIARFRHAIRLPALLAFAGGLIYLAAPHTARAQASAGLGGGGAGTAGMQGMPMSGPAPVAGGNSEGKRPAAAALPGATSSGDMVAPPQRLANDMSPNEALFDAVNRGDIVAARDALSRGADLEAHNVLGLTPIELSVDLARNDITFMLLSQRGASLASVAPPPPPVVAKPVRTRVQQTLPVQKVAAEMRVAPSASALPASGLPGGNGGVPVPQAGFLGFGVQEDAAGSGSGGR